MRPRNASTGKLDTMHINSDMRVKLAYGTEKRIIPISRPVMIDQLQAKIHKLFHQDLDINYENGEVYIPVVKQTDLDKAIALLDQSPHLTSLHLTLLPKTIKNFPIDPYTSMHYPEDDDPPGIDIYQRPVKHNSPRSSGSLDRGLTTMDHRQKKIDRSISQPEIHHSPLDEELMRSIVPLSNPPHSPPPGHPPYEGIFIPEDVSHHKSRFDIFHEPRENGKFYPSTGDSTDSLDSVLSPSPTSIRRDGDIFRRSEKGQQRRPLSDVVHNTHPTELYYFIDDMNPNSYIPSLRTRTRSDGHDIWDLVDSGCLTTSTTSTTGSVISVSEPSDKRVEKTTDNTVSIETDSEYLEKMFETIMISERLEQVKQLRQLGAGAFGTVYLCVDTNSGKEMAMKRVETGLVNPASLKDVEVLLKEIQLYKTLKHDRIVKYYGTFQDDKALSIFMEYMEGGSLHEKISKKGALPEEYVARYCRQITEGLAYLHSKNIIHRDIKGANILLDKNDNCKLADFGASRQIKTIRSKTGCKSVHGTPYWMSPEVINGQGYGRKADIWSLGCTVIEMLTTKPPWFKFEPLAALFKIATQPTLPHIPRDVSTKCILFMELCLQEEASSRPSADELLCDPFLIKS